MRNKQAILLDIVWAFWIVVSLLIFCYLPTWVDTDQVLAIKSIIGFTLLMGGTVMSLVLIGFRSDRFFSLEDVANSLGYIIISLGAVFMVNRVTASLQLSSVPINSTLFIMLMGIAEEAFFRGFLLGFVNRLTGSSLIAMVLSSFVGMVYHAAVYGTVTTNMVIVFGSFFVLGFCYVLSGYRLSVTMSAHALINLMSSWS